MQGIWAHFDGLQPEPMLAAYAEAVNDYLATEAATPDSKGLQEVEGFAGKRSLAAYQTMRVWELACHSWDVYVTRDPQARLHPQAVVILAPNLHQTFVPLDKDRAAALTTTSVAFKLIDSGATYILDPGAERPRAQHAASTANAALVIEGPDEEVIRFLAGRHVVPGTQPKLKVARGSAQDLANFKRALR